MQGTHELDWNTAQMRMLQVSQSKPDILQVCYNVALVPHPGYVELELTFCMYPRVILSAVTLREWIWAVFGQDHGNVIIY